MKTVVFCCFTPYQLINSVYYGLKLGKKVRRILIWHNYTGYKIGMERFQGAFDDMVLLANFYQAPFFRRQYLKCLYGGWLFRRSEINKCMEGVDHSQTTLMIYSDQHIVTRRLIELYAPQVKQVILVEEGMSTYLIRYRKIPKTRDWWINLFLGARYEPYIGANRAIDTIFVKHPEFLPEEKTVGRTVIRQNNVFRDAMWQSIFSDLLRGFNWTAKSTDNPKEKMCGIDLEEPGKVRLPRKTLLWLGQPVEGDGISTQAQLTWIRSVCAELPENYTVVIKAHPREAEDKYKELVEEHKVYQVQLNENNWIPIEILASMINPDVLLTVYSTAAQNISELGIKCKVAYCYRHFGLELGDTSGLVNGTNVYRIADVSELKTVLESDYIVQDVCTNQNENLDLMYLQSER